MRHRWQVSSSATLESHIQALRLAHDTDTCGNVLEWRRSRCHGRARMLEMCGRMECTTP